MTDTIERAFDALTHCAQKYDLTVLMSKNNLDIIFNTQDNISAHEKMQINKDKESLLQEMSRLYNILRDSHVLYEKSVISIQIYLKNTVRITIDDVHMGQRNDAGDYAYTQSIQEAQRNLESLVEICARHVDNERHLKWSFHGRIVFASTPEKALFRRIAIETPALIRTKNPNKHIRSLWQTFCAPELVIDLDEMWDNCLEEVFFKDLYAQKTP